MPFSAGISFRLQSCRLYCDFFHSLHVSSIYRISRNCNRVSPCVSKLHLWRKWHFGHDDDVDIMIFFIYYKRIYNLFNFIRYLYTHRGRFIFDIIFRKWRKCWSCKFFCSLHLLADYIYYKRSNYVLMLYALNSYSIFNMINWKWK